MCRQVRLVDSRPTAVSLTATDDKRTVISGGYFLADLELVIGGKRISSWSLRPWLVMKHFDVPFREQTVELSSLDVPMWARREKLMAHSPSGLVPVLRAGELAIWESTAICEYIAERFPDRPMWPRDPEKRAIARAVSAEMHAGFGDLRSECPVNVGFVVPTPDLSLDARTDIARVSTIWRDCRARYGVGGDFLFGDFSIADAMFAPVVTRFRTYGIAVDGPAAAYADAVWNLPAMQAWVTGARSES